MATVSGYQLTPRGQFAAGLLKLLDAMIAMDRTFNAALVAADSDVSRLVLVDNGVGWEAVCEPCDRPADSSYDLWFRGELKHSNMSLDAAAKFLLARYHESKQERVWRRIGRS